MASHFAPKTTQVGPAIIVSQWALERTIDNLGEEISVDPHFQKASRRNATRDIELDTVTTSSPSPA